MGYRMAEQALRLSYTMGVMRRGLSILLALVVGLGPLASALPGSEDAALPACCRRHGAHRCSMAAHMAAAMTAESSAKPFFTTPTTCPMYPGPAIAVLTPAFALMASQAQPGAPENSVRVLLPGSSTILLSASYTHAGRGPPALCIA